MKKFLLFLSFLTIFVAFTAQASLVPATINVDNAANVKVAYGPTGDGDEIVLGNGSNSVSLDDSQQPLYIGSKNGATITEIKVNGTPSMALRNNECRLGISEGMIIDITTSAPSSEATVTFSASTPGSVKISFDDTETTSTLPQTVATGTTIRITPMPGFSISAVSCLNGIAVNNNDDAGSWSVQINGDETVYITTAVTGVSFGVNIDNVNNVAVSLGQGLDEYSLTWLINGDNTVVSTTAYMPVNFAAANGATITKITRNGSEINGSPYSGYHSAFEEGDRFVITTKSAVSPTGIIINADKAERILIKQANGYGEVLSLVDGENPFEIGNIENPIKISATQGNEITAVTYNGEPRTPSNDGSYIVKVEAGGSLAITSREIPEDISVTFAVSPADAYKLLNIAVDGTPLTLASATTNHTVKAGAVVTLSCKAGYVIKNLNCGGNDCEETDGVYTVKLSNPATISLTVEEMQAQEGYAVVTFDINKSTVNLDEYDGKTFVRSLESSKAYEIKTGHTVNIYTFNRTTFFNEVSVNGVPVQPVDGNEKSFEITIEGKSHIKADAYSKVEVVTYNTYNPENHSTIGKLYVKDGDGKATSYYANAGETVEFIAEPAAGYILDYVKRVAPESDTRYTTYTIEPQDIEAQWVIFEGVFVEDEENQSFVVRGETTYVQSDEGVIQTGDVKVMENGVERIETIAYEGSDVTLVAYPSPGYKFKRFMLWRDNEITISNPYTVSADHADETKVINISAEFVPNSDSLEETVAGAGLSYDSENNVLSSALEMNVYDISGRLIVSSEAGTLSLSDIGDGIYIAVSGNQSIKFTKK